MTWENHVWGVSFMSVQLEIADVNTRDNYSGTKAAAWFAFALTFLLYVCDYLDRQIVSSMFPAIKANWSLTDTQLSYLTSIIMITVGLLSIPISIIADRWSRVKCIFLMAAVWSIATVASTFAADYTQLLGLRGLVGVGEAAYAPVGMALLATAFPSKMRSVILASFNAGITLGSIGGAVLGGVIATHYGWKMAFGIVGFPGLILAVLFLFVKEPGTHAAQPTEAKRETTWTGLTGMGRMLLQSPSIIWLYICSSLQLFVTASIVVWLPSFLNRAYNLPMDKAGIRTGLVLIASSIGAVLFGFVADRVGRYRPGNKFNVIAVSTILTSVVMLIAFNFIAPGPLQYATIVLGGLFLGGTFGTVSALNMDVVHPSVRATSMGVGALIQNLLGIAVGPVVVGMISDRFGLSTALAIIPFASLLAGVGFLLMRPAYERDLKLRTASRAA
jgi:MFS family permease